MASQHWKPGRQQNQQQLLVMSNNNMSPQKQQSSAQSAVPEYQNSYQDSEPQYQPKQRPVNERVQVYVRVRPIFNGEMAEDIQAVQAIKNLQNTSPTKSSGFLGMDTSVQEVDQEDPNRSGCIRFTPNQSQMLTLDIRPREARKHDFVFRSIFRPESTQLEVFEKTALPLVMHVLNGYNGTYFVYGQTGTGKTHSMGVLSQIDETSKGIIPQSLEFIFSSLEELQSENLISDWKVHISFFQIYLEQVSDLLNPEAKKMNIREEQGEVFVGDLVEVPVETLDQAMNIVNAGLIHRMMASQAMNDTSSRSHTVLHIDVYQTRHRQDTADQVEYLKGRLVLVDLAGSERVNKTKSKGIRFEEAKHINASLTTLGNVISCLANPFSNNQSKGKNSRATTKDTFIPYRSSKLTRILTNSLSYDSKIVLLATLGPVRSSFHESLGTLQFAQRCQDIILKPKMHLETEQESPQQVIERLTHHLAGIESRHAAQMQAMETAAQEALNSRDQHIAALETQVQLLQEEVQKQQSSHQLQQESQLPPKTSNSYRALQVADMTTFMAKLLQKLTEMSCTLANQCIQEQNEFITAFQKSQKQNDEYLKGRIYSEFPIEFHTPFEFSESETLKFESNTQLLTDESLDIAGLVTQLQGLAKKHNQSLSTMAEQSKLCLKLRIRATQIEKEKAFTTSRLRKSNKENTELLLGEIAQLYRPQPDLPRYLQQTLLPKLQDLDGDFRNRITQTTQQTANILALAKKDTQQSRQSEIVVPPKLSAVSGHSGIIVPPQTALVTTRPDQTINQRSQAPLASLSRSMTPVLVSRKLEFKKMDSIRGTQAENNPSNSRKQLDVVLHRHPLHVDRNGRAGSALPEKVIQKAQKASTSSFSKEAHEHSFASIVKTQQQHRPREEILRQSPTHGDVEPKKPLIAKKPQFATKTENTDEDLLRPALKKGTIREETKTLSIPVMELDPEYSRQEKSYSAAGSNSDQLIDISQSGSNLSQNGLNMSNAQFNRSQQEGQDRSSRREFRNEAAQGSMSALGSRRSQATVNSTAHQQVRLDNLIVISKSVTERVWNDIEDYFLQPE